LSSSPPPSFARVVVALDTRSFGELALQVAREVARSPVFEILGLFVEDSNLLEHASAPLAREIALSGRIRPLEAGRLQRTLAAQATLARGIFEEAATRAGLRHAFRVARGSLVDELLRAAADAEALIVALRRRDRARAATLAALARAQLRALLFARDDEQAGEGILAVIDEGGAQTEPLRVAARLAQRVNAPLRVLRAAGSHDEPAMHAQIAAMRSSGIALELLPPAADLTAETIARHARDASLSILLSRGAPHDEPLIEHLLAKTNAALLLIRAEG